MKRSLKGLTLLFAGLLGNGLLNAQGIAPATDDDTLPALTAIAGRGMMASHEFESLEYLSDFIGGRITGSPEAGRAVAWGLERMHALGLANVHAETWPLKHGWQRLSAHAELLSPVARPLHISALGWVGSTPAGGVEAEVITVNSNLLDEEMKQHLSNWKGKVLLVITKGEAPKDRISAFGKFGTFLTAAHQAGAVAVIGGQGGRPSMGMHLTHTGVLGFDAYYPIPVVSMTAEDQAMIMRFLEQGKAVRLKVDVQNRLSPGPVESANVVGEILGVEHPEQIIVVGGHLDSWDLSQGATDNGMGVACTLGAAEAIQSSGFKPKRTIRFVLFTGEEQGLLGSLAYTKSHQAEMPNHVAALILDNGQGPVTSLDLGGHKDLTGAVETFTEKVKGFGEIKVTDRTEFGTDTAPFTLQGLPGINMGQDSPDYKYTHHSEADSFDKIKPDVLARDATLMAMTAYWIAARPERLAAPWTPERTAQALVDSHDDALLKAFGLWTFGNLGGPGKKTEK